MRKKFTMENIFKIGDKVCKISRADMKEGTREGITWDRLFDSFNEREGVVIATDDKRKQNRPIVVTWEKSSQNSYIQRDEETYEHSPKELMLVSDAQQQYTDMFNNYEALASKIKTRMEAAKNEIDEAAKLLNGTEFRSLSEFYNECYPMKRAINTIGWNSSSLTC